MLNFFRNKPDLSQKLRDSSLKDDPNVINVLKKYLSRELIQPDYIFCKLQRQDDHYKIIWDEEIIGIIKYDAHGNTFIQQQP